jgi:hypothetical protein
MRKLMVALALCLVGQGALAWEQPGRGTATRGALMDAIRPHLEWRLGAPIEFVVHDLRVQGPVAFAAVTPQRPGGGHIDLGQTPRVLRGDVEMEYLDNIGVQALYRKSGKTWVAVHWGIGATDVWYSDPTLCASWRTVIPEACQGM